MSYKAGLSYSFSIISLGSCLRSQLEADHCFQMVKVEYNKTIGMGTEKDTGSCLEYKLGNNNATHRNKGYLVIAQEFSHL